jgi:hypothetical protein
MMGVTNHWVSLLAHKYNDRVEFCFFDSNNRNCWNWNEAQRKLWLQKKNEKRIKQNKKPLDTFKMWV